MPSVNVQFHMLFEELIEFVSDAMREYSLAVELEQFPGKTRVVATASELPNEVVQFGHVDRIWLLFRPARARKDEKFSLKVGRLRDGRLEQSHLGAGTDKPDAFAVLKKVAYRLRKRTKAGLWVIGCTGNVGFAKTFRVSPESAEASRAGRIELVAVGFTQRFHVDPPGC